MDKVKVKLPDLGEGIETANISFWHVQEQEKVKKGDDLVEVVTEKSTFNVSSPATGIVSEIKAHEGKEVKVNEVLAVIQTGE